MLLATELYFELDGVMIEPERGGERIATKRDDVTLAIYLPSASDASKFAHVGAARQAGSSHDPRDYDPQVACVEHGPRLREVRLVRVVANVEVPDDWESATRHDGAARFGVAAVCTGLL